MSKLYALLVGINDYPEGVPKLSGCVSDAGRYRDYLTHRFAPEALALEILTDAQATREAMIGMFRSHLAKAGPDDVVLFQYSGHGAQSTSAPEFLEFQPDGKDTGLVGFDSRLPGKFDLADKELAVLIAEVAARNPHIAVIFDCCHSGSGTRSADEINGAVARFTGPATYKRELGSYIDEYYAAQAKTGGLSIPVGRHILLAGCEQTQTAKERDGAGIFTSTLMEVLEKSGPDINYADLFVRARAAVRKRAADQDPQFETMNSFNAFGGFLGSAAARIGRRFRAVYDMNRGWQVNCGAIHGAPTDATRQVGFALYDEDAPAGAEPLGTATTTTVGAQASDLALGFTVYPGTLAYAAEMTSLPVAPMLVGFDGPAGHRDALAAALAADPLANVALVGADDQVDYTITVSKQPGGDALVVSHRESGRMIGGAAFDPAKPDAGTADLVSLLKHIAQWQRTLALQNKTTKMDPAQVEVAYLEQRADGSIVNHPAGDTMLEYRQVDGVWQAVRGRMRVRNLTDQKLNVALFCLTSAYAVFPVINVELPIADTSAAEGGWMTLMGDQPREVFALSDGENESIDVFKIVVSTERLDDFLLVQDPLPIGKIVGSDRAFVAAMTDAEQARLARKIPFENEWFTKAMRFRTVRRLDVAGPTDAPLANGAITVKGHPSLKANLALTAAVSNTRSVGDPDFYRAFQQQGMAMVDFAAGTRDVSAGAANILELTDIENAGSLAEQPLQITLKVPLAQGETILPLAFDGEFIRLGGDATRQEDGSTLISIDRIPEPAQGTRSVLGSLKLYFFKTALKQANVNLLRWVDYTADGSFERQKFGVADKVAAARNILLLVHGIIGDTEDMAAGVKACGVAGKFDLVLTYDYENLGTLIGDTAGALAKQLKGVGIGAGDGKTLTVLAHSMGGLVARWCIEKGDGKVFVDHLVMCGTPNNGSPFGKIDGALAIVDLLGDLSVNVMPAAVPFVTPLRAVLKQVRAVTPTLAQMNPASQFILDLNASDDPGVRYTILAGNIDDYSASQDAFFGRLMAKAGRSNAFGLVFEHQPNDIAVGVESIRGVGGVRAAPPLRIDVACHHLNYFACPPGRAALAAVAW
ncbi:MAG: caspase family protein [Sandarakinorhabdus sp.]|nr:caspase family protein [Sandarakinorhabdus sp.]